MLSSVPEGGDAYVIKRVMMDKNFIVEGIRD